MPSKTKRVTPLRTLDFTGDSPSFCVRNTFIDFEECLPSAMFLRTQRRAQSWPALQNKHMDMSTFKEIDGESSACENVAESSDDITCAGADCGSLFPVPPSQALSKALATHQPQTVPGTVLCPAPASRPQALEWTYEANGSIRVCWKVDARKLRGNDKQAVSPPFELPLGPHGQSMKLRIAIYPKASDVKSSINFRSSKGKGYIQVKCESDMLGESAPVSLSLSVGAGSLAQPARGCIQHNFAHNGICGLPRNKDTWDFSSAVEAEHMMFQIFLGIASRCD